jgi:hypothetical protein
MYVRFREYTVRVRACPTEEQVIQEAVKLVRDARNIAPLIIEVTLFLDRELRKRVNRSTEQPRRMVRFQPREPLKQHLTIRLPEPLFSTQQSIGPWDVSFGASGRSSGMGQGAADNGVCAPLRALHRLSGFPRLGPRRFPGSGPRQRAEGAPRSLLRSERFRWPTAHHAW